MQSQWLLIVHTSLRRADGRDIALSHRAGGTARDGAGAGVASVAP